MKRFVISLTVAVFLILAILYITPTLFANTIRVPADQLAIQAAIDAASHGDTVLVSPGVYVENIDFKGKKLVVGSLFLTTGDTTNISQTIIDGNQQKSVVSFENFQPVGTELAGFSIRNGLGMGDFPNVHAGGIHIGRQVQSQIRIRYCYIYGNESIGVSNRGGGIFVEASAAIIFNCRVFNNTADSGAGIFINAGFETVIDSCAIFNNNGFSAIGIGFSVDVQVRRTVIYNNQADGIRNALSNGTQLIHCTIAGNSVAGFKNDVGQTTIDTLHIVNSIVYGNGQPPDVDNDTSVQATYSIIQGGISEPWFGEGCLDTDPLFANASFELSANSPANDAGDPNSPNDPDGTRADMGAHFFEQATSVNTPDDPTPSIFVLHQNYPNPFNPSTTIAYSLQQAGEVEIKIFDLQGRKVRSLVRANQPAGEYSVVWDGRDAAGQAVSSGTYFYQIEAGEFQSTRRMLLLR